MQISIYSPFCDVKPSKCTFCFNVCSRILKCVFECSHGMIGVLSNAQIEVYTSEMRVWV